MIWKNPFLLAPLAGYTDSIFRKICFEHGCGMAVSEMVSAKGLCYKNENTKDLLKIDKGEGPVCIQLFGHEPEMFRAAIKELDNISGLNPCGIDINMGCPVNKVVKSGEGSALLNTPAVAAECVRACVESTNLPVSVKMRIGFDAADNAANFARAMESAGVSFIAVHGRTREQFYSGSADWDKIAEIKRSVSVPVIGNGDVFSAEDALRMLDKTKVDAVMIARGAMGNPWIFEECLALMNGRQCIKPSFDEIRETMLRHAAELVNQKGEYVGIRQMRSHAGYYIKGIRGASRIRGSVNSCESLDEFVKLIKEI